MPIGSIVGGLIGAGGAQAAGSASAAAGQQAFANSQQEAQRARSALSPWSQTGTSATGQLGSLYGFGKFVGDNNGNYGYDPSNAAADQKAAMAKFFTSPGYDFRRQEGVNALDRSAASRGMLLSGAQAKGVSDYGQNTASNEWANYINQLNTMSGQGLNATSSANNTSASLINSGNNALFQGNMGQANSYQNAANALGSGIANGVNNLAAIGAFGYGQGWFGGGPTGANAGGMAGNPMTTGLGGL